jgi:NADPH-dependent 2,4-dienoyl-CoA reductase/sulfur reductase-like enzyme/nitrite reductase/ring-hydroxylating ferredoxin subunit
MVESSKPDFSLGVRVDELPDGEMLVGRVAGEDAILIRQQDQCFVIGALCSHYHGELSKGLIAGETVRCPLHHACFSLRNGAALGAPALDPVACWRVERIDGHVFARERVVPAQPKTLTPGPATPESIVIVGAGAAALAAAVTLRNEGYDNDVTLISSDDSPPYDRPNVSKDFLAGTAPEEWMPLRSSEFYAHQRIKVLLNTSVQALDLRRKRVYLEGRELSFGALLIATGSEAARIDIPGAAAASTAYLRTLANGRDLLKRIAHARRIVVLGTGFIGLEAAAALRSRGIEVDVVSREKIPMERALGPELGTLLYELHRSHGVNFHLDKTVGSVDGHQYRLSDGTELEADLLIAGVGARPCVDLAQRAGLSVDHGVIVDEYLRTSVPDVFAAGDIARYPAYFSGDSIRVEHWVHAQRQGQTAARNMLGAREPFRVVPFFWTQQYDLAVNMTGHADRWDTTRIEGDVSKRDCLVRYLRDGRVLAVATVSRDLENLRAERALETIA